MTLPISAIYIGLKKLNAVYVPLTITLNKPQINNHISIMTFNAEMMALGHVMSENLYQHLLVIDDHHIATLHKQVIDILKAVKGADVSYQPLYPNFPRQVMETSNFELYVNALMHYWSFGGWLPQYEVLPRPNDQEFIQYKTLDLVHTPQLKTVFTQLLRSADSLSEEDQAIIEWFITQDKDNTLIYPDNIPFLETKCLVAGIALKQGKDISTFVKTTTDVLRIMTYLSDGDISLAKNTRFQSLPRSMRRRMVMLLETVIREEDVRRHRQKWGKLFHNLHVGDYSQKVYDIAQKVRHNEKMYSFNGTIEALIKQGEILVAADQLAKRPGEFGRRLDHLLRSTTSTQQQLLVIRKFLTVVDDIPTKNLLQLLGYLSQRNNDQQETVIFPKGKVQNAVVLQRQLIPLKPYLLNQLLTGIKGSLLLRFSKFESLGKVWIDPELMDCPLPSQQRSATAGLWQVARGTQLPLQADGAPLKDTLRFFIYWIGQDIDLSATLHDEHCNMISHVSYQQLKSDKYQAYHSGDITSAPNGACEFIDISLSGARQSGARYLVMNVLVFSGPTFAEHKTCYAGWMTREKPNSREIFDPTTVQQKIDVSTDSRSTMPVIFDLQNHKAIWADVSGIRKKRQTHINNVNTQRASIEQLLKAIINTAESKVSLYELFDLHTEARGERVASIEEADQIFSLTQGITPYHITEIQADYMADTPTS